MNKVDVTEHIHMLILEPVKAERRFKMRGSHHVLPTKLTPQNRTKVRVCIVCRDRTFGDCHDRSKLNPNDAEKAETGVLCGWWSERRRATFLLTTLSSHYYLWHPASCENRLGLHSFGIFSQRLLLLQALPSYHSLHPSVITSSARQTNMGPDTVRSHQWVFILFVVILCAGL